MTFHCCWWHKLALKRSHAIPCVFISLIATGNTTTHTANFSLFHYKNWYAKAPRCFVTRASPILFIFRPQACVITGSHLLNCRHDKWSYFETCLVVLTLLLSTVWRQLLCCSTRWFLIYTTGNYSCSEQACINLSGHYSFRNLDPLSDWYVLIRRDITFSYIKNDRSVPLNGASPN